jgi:hypothetical protein
MKKILKYILFCFNYFRIPKGTYCYKIIKIIYPKDGSYPYHKIKICPYWDKIKEFPEQDNGYCHWLERGDFDYDLNDEFHFLDENIIKEVNKKYKRKTGHGLLWDQCKECHLREYNLKDYE